MRSSLFFHSLSQFLAVQASASGHARSSSSSSWLGDWLSDAFGLGAAEQAVSQVSIPLPAADKPRKKSVERKPQQYENLRVSERDASLCSVQGGNYCILDNFVINLERRKDRLKTVRMLFRNALIPFQRVEAKDGVDFQKGESVDEGIVEHDFDLDFMLR